MPVECVTQIALEAWGGNGHLNDYPAGRCARDAKLYETGAGIQEVRCMLVSRELLKK